MVLTVGELLDVAVASLEPADVLVTPGAAGQVLKFAVTNGGNGPEAFKLATVASGGGDDFDPAVTSLVLDSNGNGAYDAGVDTVYVAGSNDPVLQPDATLAVFVLSTIPASLADTNRGRVDLTAASLTGSGTPGTTFAGAGEGGGDAVAGATGGAGLHDGYYKIAGGPTATLVKTAAVSDPFGGTTSTPGSVITYRLALSVGGTGTLANVRIDDPIPTGTTYQSATLTLDGSALTDAGDADAGQFAGTAIQVALGNVPAGSSHAVTFQVKIN